VIGDTWRSGRITVEWPIRVMGWWRAAGVLRVHDDENQIPGSYNCSACIIVKDAGYEFMGFTRRGTPPTRTEFKTVYAYLQGVGLHKFRHIRAKGGNVYAIIPHEG
jgi:hypothetical protein